MEKQQRTAAVYGNRPLTLLLGAARRRTAANVSAERDYAAHRPVQSPVHEYGVYGCAEEVPLLDRVHGCGVYGCVDLVHPLDPLLLVHVYGVYDCVEYVRVLVHPRVRLSVHVYEGCGCADRGRVANAYEGYGCVERAPPLVRVRVCGVCGCADLVHPLDRVCDRDADLAGCEYAANVCVANVRVVNVCAANVHVDRDCVESGHAANGCVESGRVESGRVANDCGREDSHPANVRAANEYGPQPLNRPFEAVSVSRFPNSSL